MTDKIIKSYESISLNRKINFIEIFHFFMLTIAGLLSLKCVIAEARGRYEFF